MPASATTTLLTIVAMLLMITAGLDKRRLEWRPRKPSWWRGKYVLPSRRK